MTLSCCSPSKGSTTPRLSSWRLRRVSTFKLLASPGTSTRRGPRTRWCNREHFRQACTRSTIVVLAASFERGKDSNIKKSYQNRQHMM